MNRPSPPQLLEPETRRTNFPETGILRPTGVLRNRKTRQRYDGRFKSRAALVVLAVLGMASPVFAQSFSGGAYHTLGIRPDGTVAAWGFDHDGSVSGANSISGATAVAAGGLHSLALLSDGTVAAWGFNGQLQLSGASSISGATGISAGLYHSLALLSDGTVAAWGSDLYGQVSGASSVSGATAISAGGSHSLALLSNGTVAAWGADYGQPSGASSVSGATAISAGFSHSLALLSNGTVAAWGSDNYGVVSGASSVSNATAISAAGFHSLALLSTGNISIWGENPGVISAGVNQTNVVHAVLSGIGGLAGLYVVRSDGTISSWGWNDNGQLNTPVGFQLPTTVRWVSATNGDYLNSHLWNGRIPSTSLSTAVFDNNGAYSINFGNTAHAKGLEVSAGDLTFNLSAHQYQVENNVNVASGSSLTVNGTLTSSGLLTNSGTYNANGQTSAQIISNNGTINVAGLLTVTDSLINRGTLEINNGSDVLVGATTPVGNGSAHLRVGKVSGATLMIMDGGSINNAGFARIGGTNGETGTLRVAGPGSQLTNAYSMDIGTAGFGEMQIVAGGRVVSGTLGSPTRIGNGNSRGEVIVHGSNSTWEMSSDLEIGGFVPSRLNIESGGVVTNQNANVGDAVVTVNGIGSAWNNQGGLFLNYHGNRLSIEAGGLVTSTSGQNRGHVVVTGNGSRWDISGDLEFTSGSGRMDVLNGGGVTSRNASIGSQNDVGYGVASVAGVGSEWINAGDLILGGIGVAYGQLNLTDGGRMDTGNATVRQGDVSVGGNNATWLISNDLQLGTNRYSTLSVNDGADVIVGNRTSITPNGQVYMNGGRFEFGKMSLDSYHQVGRYGGSMEGLVELSGVHNMANLEPSFSNSSTDISQVRLSNTGILSGSGLVDVGLANQTTGQVRATANDWMRFGGAGNTNAGRIANLGGVIEFGGDMTNQSTGFITGRGAFIANNWVNQGSIAVSGTTDIIGNMDNRGGSLIVTSANATTTFYDSVINNGEIRTSGNGNSVFFEAVSGAGNYTGTGNVFFEGNVNPGNSPSVVNFGGNLTLGSASHTLFEIGGVSPGEFDRLNIAGSFSILGSMSVVMWNDFQLTPGMSFMIADIAGNRSGMFSNFGEGALVGNFSGQNLFITYGAGSGNDIALFTAVPEPGALTLCLSLGLASLIRRRKGNRASFG